MTCFEIVMSILTAIYVGTTIFYAITSHQTLRAIECQGKSSTEQFTEQIAEAKKSADAAKVSADDAAKSADALTHSERAWIYPEFTVADVSKWAYNMVATNFGRTLGKINTVRIGFACIKPYEKPKPPFEFGLSFPEENILILPTQPIVLRNIVITDYLSEEWNDISTGQKQAIVFAAVEYEDMVGELHQSFMSYSYRTITFQLEDVRSCRKYL